MEQSGAGRRYLPATRFAQQGGIARIRDASNLGIYDPPHEPRVSGRLQSIVNGALELAVEPDGLVIGERQDLGQDDARNALLRVGPVIGVVEAAPSQASGAAPLRACLS